MKNSYFKRAVFDKILGRVSENRQFIQVLAGPRQVGKTTLARAVLQQFPGETLYVSADNPTLQDHAWLEAQWAIARGKCSQGVEVLLVLDEIQKITDWSSKVKQLWDEDTVNEMPLKVMLLGSSPLLVQQGLSESLAGRFEIVPITHWSFVEMHQAFGFDLEQYIYYGAYPGSAPLIDDQQRWQDYINNSLIETSISRDVLLMSRVHKPALLRRLFQLSCEYSGQVLSYQKMTGQLQEAGNTTTLSHYLNLLSGAGLVIGLNKYASQAVRKRASSPKLQVLNTALINAQGSLSFDEARADQKYWGRLLESAVAMHLLNQSLIENIQIYYWRHGKYEVDFVMQKNKQIIAIEVKSENAKNTWQGMKKFHDAFAPARLLQIGGRDGESLETFFRQPLSDWFLENY